MNCKINNRRGTTPQHPTLGARSPTSAAGQCGVPHAKRMSALLSGYPTPPTIQKGMRHLVSALRSVGCYPTPPHAPKVT